MRNHFLPLFMAVGGGLLALPVAAEGELVGDWSGAVTAVVINPRYAPVSPFAAIEDADKQSGSRFVEARVSISIEEQKHGLAVGKWTSKKDHQQFVCAQLSVGSWDCIDASARATVRLTSENLMKVCYLNPGSRSQVAACGELSKVE